MRPIDKIAFGKRFAARRNAVGISQPKLAELVGMSQQGIQSIEGGAVARPGRIMEIAAALRTTQEWLLYGDGPEEISAIDEDRLEDVLAELFGLAGRKDPRSAAHTTIEQLKAPAPAEDEETAQALFLLRWKQSLERVEKPRRSKRPETR